MQIEERLGAVERRFLLLILASLIVCRSILPNRKTQPRCSVFRLLLSGSLNEIPWMHERQGMEPARLESPRGVERIRVGLGPSLGGLVWYRKNGVHRKMLHVLTMALIAVLSGQVSQAGGDEDKPLGYEAAYRKAQEEKKPLVVLVGAEWCPACKTMKSDTIDPMKKAGELKEVIYTHLDKDAHPELAQQVMQGKLLPQIVVFSESDSGWRRYSLTGMQSPRRVRELIRKASEALPRRR